MENTHDEWAGKHQKLMRGTWYILKNVLLAVAMYLFFC